MRNIFFELKTPLKMLVFQAFLLCALYLSLPRLRQFTLPTLLFWAYSLLSYTIYFITSQTSPGFITPKELDFNSAAKDQKMLSEERSVLFSSELSPKAEPAPTSGQNIDKAPSVANLKNDTNRSEEVEEDKEHSVINDVSIRFEEIQITEIRHCTVCRIDQPIRAKHCRECEKCIATHDHHCPWLGICIGERNKRTFYVYLVVQLVHLIWVTVMISMGIRSQDNFISWAQDNWHKVLLAFIVGLFVLMVGGLLAFHVYLASVNLTTWEFMSWKRISYLKTLDWKHGSPFSKGILSNLYISCFKKRPKYLIMWEIEPPSGGL